MKSWRWFTLFTSGRILIRWQRHCTSSTPRDWLYRRNRDVTDSNTKWHRVINYSYFKNQYGSYTVRTSFTIDLQFVIGVSMCIRVGNVGDNPVTPIVEEVSFEVTPWPWNSVPCPYRNFLEERTMEDTRSKTSEEGTLGDLCDRLQTHRTKVGQSSSLDCRSDLIPHLVWHNHDPDSVRCR